MEAYAAQRVTNYPSEKEQAKQKHAALRKKLDGMELQELTIYSKG